MKPRVLRAVPNDAPTPHETCDGALFEIETALFRFEPMHARMLAEAYVKDAVESLWSAAA